MSGFKIFTKKKSVIEITDFSASKKFFLLLLLITMLELLCQQL